MRYLFSGALCNKYQYLKVLVPYDLNNDTQHNYVQHKDTSIMCLNVTLSMNDTQENVMFNVAFLCLRYHLFFVMLNAIILSVVMLSVIRLSVIRLSVIMLSVVMLSVIGP
jgi:hypothetical protein